MAFESQWRYLPTGVHSMRGKIGGVGQTAVSFDKTFFTALENFIRQTMRMRGGVPKAMNTLALWGAATHMGQAQQRSLGPLDPQERNPQAAWKVPVRRISGRYFFGWKIKRVGNAAYLMLNDSREAYFIEFGIHTSNRRIRRPIMKLSMLKTLEFLKTTAISDRIWADIAFPPPGQRTGKGFLWRMQSPGMMDLPPGLKSLSNVTIPGLQGP